MTSLKLVEGYMPMQMLFELAFCVAVFAGISYLLSKSGVQLPTILARYSVLGVYSHVSQVSDLPSHSVQRPRDVWDGVVDRRVYVDVQQ